MSASIWYVEDDPHIADFTKGCLEEAGFCVRLMTSGLEVRNALTKESPKLLMIDWSLPADAGPSICRWIRHSDPTLPIMMVTVRDDPADVVEGLRSGADDYVTKPFNVAVLVSRIEALLRRIAPDSTTFTCGGIFLNNETGKVYVHDELLDLTAMEYRLLLLFMQNKGRLLSRDAIRKNIWPTDVDQASDNTITVAIKRLRAKLGDEDHLKTVRSFGYRLEEPL